MSPEGIAEMLKDAPAAASATPAGRLQEAKLAMERALADTRDRFGDLPSLVRLRERWKANGIHDDDPAWILVEAASWADERQHTRSLALMAVLAAHAELTTRTVDECEAIVAAAGKLEMTVGQTKAALHGFNGQVGEVARLLKTLAGALTPLIDYMHRSMKILEDRTVKAALLQVGIIAVSIVIGMVIMRMVA